MIHQYQAVRLNPRKSYDFSIAQAFGSLYTSKKSEALWSIVSMIVCSSFVYASWIVCLKRFPKVYSCIFFAYKSYPANHTRPAQTSSIKSTGFEDMNNLPVVEPVVAIKVFLGSQSRSLLKSF